MNSQQSRAARALLKWSQTQLADVAGVGLSTVADFENDKRIPWSDNLTAIRRALEDGGVSLSLPEMGRKSAFGCVKISRKEIREI